MTLIEMLVAMVILIGIMASFFTLYEIFASSATNTIALSEDQGSVRYVMRVLEADIRSADPLVLVPSSFTAPSGAVTNSGTNGTTPTDVIAMFSNDDTFAPCPADVTTTSVGAPPEEFISQTTVANVIWAYDPTGHTLTRWSYCQQQPSGTPPTTTVAAAWTAGVVLRNVDDPAGTMFTVVQSSGPFTQTQVPSPTATPNQSVPACGSSVTVSIIVKARAQRIPFKARVAVALPNEGAVSAQACS